MDSEDAAAREWEAEMAATAEARQGPPGRLSPPSVLDADMEALQAMEEDDADNGRGKEAAAEFFTSKTVRPHPAKPAMFESSQDEEAELDQLKKDAARTARDLKRMGGGPITSSPYPAVSSPSRIPHFDEDMSDESDTEANVDTTKDSKRSGLLNISYLDTILHPDRVSAALEQEDIDGYGQEADDSGSPSASPPGIRLQLHGSVDDTIDSLEDADRADGRFGEPEDEDAKDYGRSEENPQNETLPNPDGDDWMLQLERLAGDDGENTGAQANYGARSSARHRMAARQAAVEDPAEDDWMAQLERAAEGGEMEDESDRYARASKRRASDLFGFDDSDVENAFPSKSSKRKLFSEDLDLRSEDDSEARARREVQERQQVVDEIRRARKANQDAEAALQTVYRWDYKRPPPGASVRARTSDQNTEVFFPFRRAVVVDPVADLRESNEHGSLLHGDNIYRILDEIDREREEKNAKDQTETQLQDIGMTADDARELAYEVHGEHALRSGKPEDRMWTDKYRPRKYTDLIGDETVNRSVLSWVKAWDYCVFGRKPKAGIIPAHEQASNRNFRGGFRGRGRGAPGGADGPSRNGPTAPPKDKFLRPDSRILLIGGPPGLGKTTLAHVVARHCGYDVIEINASDERAASTLTNRVEAATQNRSLLGSTITGSKSKTDSNGQGKPSLIVLDEIDGVSQAEGAGGNFIKILVEMVTASADSGAQDGDGPDGENQEDGEETGAAKKRGKKGKKVAKYPPLRRPIICICNDPYSPALRELRNVALLINIRVPPVKVLAKRLEDICQWEGLSVELRTLMALVEETQGDIRSCLLTLQFVRSKTNRLTYSDLQTLSVGRKDSEKSLFAVWDAIFQLPSAKQERNALFGAKTDEGGGDLSHSQHISNLLSMINAQGEHERLLQGCFETYAKQRHVDVSTDPSKTRINQLLDYLTGFHDVISNRTGVTHTWELGGYLPYIFIAFHRFFATTHRARVEWPKADYEAYVATKTNDNVLQLMQKGLGPKAKLTWNIRNTALELTSPLLRIMSPELRPVNVQLMKAEERRTLKRLINLMVGLGLDFKQEKTAPEDRLQAGQISSDGNWVFRLEPPLQRLIEFSTDSMPLASRGILSYGYAVRQMVAHELEFERVRRTEKARAERERELAELDKKGSAKAAAEAMFGDARQAEAQTAAERALADEKAAAEAAEVEEKRKQEEARKRKQELKDRVLEKITARKPDAVVQAKVATDFFGRPLAKKESVFDDDEEMDENDDPKARSKPRKKAKATEDAKAEFRVVYKFNEGFSNAIRTPLYIKDFL